MCGEPLSVALDNVRASPQVNFEENCPNQNSLVVIHSVKHDALGVKTMSLKGARFMTLLDVRGHSLIGGEDTRKAAFGIVNEGEDWLEMAKRRSKISGVQMKKGTKEFGGSRGR